MRPIKLTMCGFGPYAGIEIIDFTKFKDQNIFLITGPTGAGKTTIFDGLCYAIFGLASGSDRESDTLRSDFSDEETLAYVELEFELRGQRYYIKRIPKQMKKKLRGEGLTEQNPEAELKIDSGNLANGNLASGKLITGVKDVNEQIEKIMGINYEQFRQIVMIPQGEFRKLLLAESKERESIFRKIFGTYQFQRVQEALEDKAKVLSRLIEEFAGRRNTYIKNIDCGNDETLKALIGKKDLNIIEICDGLEANIKSDLLEEETNLRLSTIMDKELGDLQKEFIQAEEMNKRIEARLEMRKRLESLEALKPAIENKNIKLQKGRKALSIKTHEDYFQNRKTNLANKKKELEDSRNQLHILEQRFKELSVLLNEEEGKGEQRRNLSELLVNLKKDLNRVIEYELGQKNLNKLKEDLEEKAKMRANNKEKIESLNTMIKTFQEELDKVKEAALLYAEAMAILTKDQEIYNKLNILHTENLELDLLREEYGNAKLLNERCEKEYNLQKRQYDHLSDLFLEGQAGILAKKLKSDAPCPVCGSLEHPNPAALVLEVPTEAKLKSEKLSLEMLEKKYHDARGNYERVKEKGLNKRKIILEKKAELHPLFGVEINTLEKEELNQFLKSNMDQYKTKIDNENQLIRTLDQKRKQEKDLVEKLLQMNKELKEENSSTTRFEEEFSKVYVRVTSEVQLLDKIKSQLPEGITTKTQMDIEIEKQDKLYKAMENAYKNIQDQYRTIELKYTEASTNMAMKKESCMKAEDELAEAKLKLEGEVSSQGFIDFDEYLVSRLSNEKIESLDSEIKEFNENIKSAADGYKKALEETAGLSIVELQKIQQRLHEKKVQKQDMEKNGKLIYARINQNKNMLEKITEINENILGKESEFSVIGQLANIAKGNNQERISFERYVLAAYFNDIIEAANTRFHRMTCGRYELSRVKEKLKGAAQQGLELEVYDNYTGKARHVKTLSGGDGFKASLALALGLADIVQSYAGGINLDTMFVDEGFGTLDPESLDNAIECLLDLQKTGRLVGIISHVPELKERIRARIEVCPSMNGSTIGTKI